MFCLVKGCVISLTTTGIKALLAYRASPPLGKQHSKPAHREETPINVVPGEQHQDAKPTKSSVCPGKPCIIIVKLLLTRERRCSNKSAALSGLLLAALCQAGCPAPHTHNQPRGAGSRIQCGSGLGCRARPRIALGGSLYAVLGEKK